MDTHTHAREDILGFHINVDENIGKLCETLLFFSPHKEAKMKMARHIFPANELTKC